MFSQGTCFPKDISLLISVPRTSITRVRSFPLAKKPLICVSIFKAYTYMTCKILTATVMFEVCLFFSKHLKKGRGTKATNFCSCSVDKAVKGRTISLLANIQYIAVLPPQRSYLSTLLQGFMHAQRELILNKLYLPPTKCFTNTRFFELVATWNCSNQIFAKITILFLQWYL